MAQRITRKGLERHLGEMVRVRGNGRGELDEVRNIFLYMTINMASYPE